MSQQEYSPTDPDQTADALAAMAEGADAQGAQAEQAAPAEPASDDPAASADALASLAADQEGTTPPDPAAPAEASAAFAPAAAPTVRLARSERRSAPQRRPHGAHTHHFKNLIFPMLLVTGLLLLLLGAVAVTMLPTAEERLSMHPDNVWGRPWTKYLVYAAFPLALILLAGAAVFWQDVRRARGKG